MLKNSKFFKIFHFFILSRAFACPAPFSIQHPAAPDKMRTETSALLDKTHGAGSRTDGRRRCCEHPLFFRSDYAKRRRGYCLRHSRKIRINALRSQQKHSSQLLPRCACPFVVSELRYSSAVFLSTFTKATPSLFFFPCNIF